MRTIVLGLGNELLADDGAGLLAARALRKELGDAADVVECDVSGMALLEILSGYDRAFIIDTICRGAQPPGTVVELAADELGSVIAPSPHYAGLPEVMAVAKELGLPFPSEIRVFAIEALDSVTIGGKLSEPVRDGISGLVSLIKRHFDMADIENPGVVN